MGGKANSKLDNSLPKINFYINFDEDLKYTLLRLSINDPAGLEYRLKNSGMDEARINKVIQTSSLNDKSELLKTYLGEYYSEHQTQMEKVGKRYQEIWKDKSTIFFTEVNKVCTPFKWKFSNYDFLTSAFYSHGSWGESNKFSVKWSRDPEIYYFMNGFELVLTHYFECIDQVYDKRPVEDWKIWALAEATAYILIYGNNPIRQLTFPNLIEPAHFSYPQLLKPIQDLKQVFSDRLNFKDYIKKSVDYIKAYSIEELKNAPK